MMSFLDQLERRFPWLAIPGLIRFVVLFNALVFILHLLAPGYESILTLNREAILQGQVWRLVTWIFIPETLQPFWIFFALLFLWFLGDGLESSLGAFRTTLFYITGMISCTIVALVFGSYGANTFLNLSLLYAFATLYPDYQVLFLFVIPLRIGWLALGSALLTILGVLSQPRAAQAALLITFLNYFLFFGSTLLQRYRQRAVSRKEKLPFSKFKKQPLEIIEPLHQCEFCHRTEQTDPDLSFRVTQDGHEYCMEHLNDLANRPNH
ncbi:MAG TPA: rhomboid family intramembrane serine protease [Chthoniobacterales bacterium]|nr:rhomboid family intramembrane serine protease [Chthoniobacterales bacterium]